MKPVRTLGAVLWGRKDGSGYENMRQGRKDMAAPRHGGEGLLQIKGSQWQGHLGRVQSGHGSELGHKRRKGRRWE